jgi:SOS-response transcriptional repressor LexA
VEWKLREDFDDVLSPEDAEYVALLDGDFRARAAELGGKGFLESLEDSLSGFVRVSDRETAVGSSTSALLNRLYEKHVDSRVQRFVTHLPFYGLRAAATRFGEDTEVAESESDVEWVRAPEGLRLSDEMFIVQVVGRSMEPLIPDGSLAVFRKFSVGSRQGKRLLIEELGATDSSARFTVKRYNGSKVYSGDEWEHSNIRLEPLNPEFPAFDLDPETFENRYRVLGEFVAVCPTP